MARTKALRLTYRRGGCGLVTSRCGDGLESEGGALQLLCDADHGDARSVTGWLVMLADVSKAPSAEPVVSPLTAKVLSATTRGERTHPPARALLV